MNLDTVQSRSESISIETIEDRITFVHMNPGWVTTNYALSSLVSFQIEHSTWKRVNVRRDFILV